MTFQKKLKLPEVVKAQLNRFIEFELKSGFA